ncbi:hypothetical protein ATY78_09975 [Rhizobium sp. R635]|uniref:hypothetical protein n=1 Tax=Rhizobium sp. R635 TaxID=1764275 RepID=UPI000B52DDF9|nr:hypothetical protein [Rhizobium sp. R635]OWV80055.1 hypothetical protein ATY78_09975 [Rhizobium sp. R635]
MIAHIRRLLQFFAPHCREVETNERLLKMIDDRGSWQGAHNLFQHIRHKTLRAERASDDVGQAQYLFEEACAKSLYNLSGATAPFDTDSPFWIASNALSLARRLNLDPIEVVDILVEA